LPNFFSKVFFQEIGLVLVASAYVNTEDNFELDIVDLICIKFVAIRFFNGSTVNSSAVTKVRKTDFPLSNMKVAPVN